VPCGEAKDVSVRLLTLLSRLRLAVWLGVAGIGVQAGLPLLLAAAIVSIEREANATGAVSAIHPHAHHAGHSSGAPHDPAHHPGHIHPNCVLCQGLQASGPVALPAAVALAAPRCVGAAVPHLAQAAPAASRAPAAYSSRAPPSTV
jgi:hypothetical protein